MTYVIAMPCVDLKDKACIEECPVDCIYEGDRMLYIQPDEWKDFTAANAEFFADLGSPGGAAKLGAQTFDAALLATVPPQEHDH